MAKHPSEEPPPTHTTHHAHAAHAAEEGKPKPGAPRVIPEFLQTEEGKTMIPTRVDTFPAEAAAGWKRFKVVGRVPHESAHPPCYVLAPDREAAIRAYREKHELTGLAPGEEVKFQFSVKELPD